MADEDLINHPKHYCQGGIECLDFITAWEMGFEDGNVVKYLARYRFKGTPMEDLKKAQFYLNHLIARLEAKEKP